MVRPEVNCRMRIAYPPLVTTIFNRIDRGELTKTGHSCLRQALQWAAQRTRYMTLETLATMSDDPLLSLPAVAA